MQHAMLHWQHWQYNEPATTTMEWMRWWQKRDNGTSNRLILLGHFATVNNMPGNPASYGYSITAWSPTTAAMTSPRKQNCKMEAAETEAANQCVNEASQPMKPQLGYHDCK
jgi:hypothetical protein